jgi:general secretion pathway protein H
MRGRRARVARRFARRSREAGYTLVELLVVMVVLGILLGMVSLSIVPDPSAKLRRDADRLEALFALAAEEAQLSSSQIAWRGDAKGYAFYRRDRASDRWVAIAGDAQFRARDWDVEPMRVTLVASDVPRWSMRNQRTSDDDGATSLAFPRDGLQPAFQLKLEANGKTVVLSGDGGGHYVVEPNT